MADLRKEVTTVIQNYLADWDRDGSFSSQVNDLSTMVIETLHECELDRAMNTIHACLKACGGSDSDNIDLMEAQCNAAGTKPSDFIRQTGGRLMQLIVDWDANGRNGHSLPVIPVELIWDIELILAGDTGKPFYPRIEEGNQHVS